MKKNEEKIDVWELKKREAKQKAESVLKKHEIVKAPVNPIEIAKKEGLDVSLYEFKEYKQISGFINYKLNKIYINSLDKFLPRQIFTIAHELGHHFLHRELTEYKYKVSMRDTTKNETTIEEVQANIFAANLLVPSKFLHEFYQKRNEYSIYSIAIAFGVSKQVIENRLCQEYGSSNLYKKNINSEKKWEDYLKSWK